MHLYRRFIPPCSQNMDWCHRLPARLSPGFHRQLSEPQLLTVSLLLQSCCNLVADTHAPYVSDDDIYHNTSRTEHDVGSQTH